MAFINVSETNRSEFSVAVESATPGVLPGSPVFKYFEANSITDMGETLGMTTRTPITSDRMKRKGGITSLDSAVSFDADLTYSMLDTFAQGFWFSSWKAQTSFVPTAVTTGGYTVASGGDLAAGTLVYARGYENATNNGLKVTDTSTGATTIDTVATLVAEASPPTGSRVDVVGVQAASGDIVVDADGNLTSTILDFTTLSLNVGQFIYIGGGTTATSFATAGDSFARIRVIAANKLTLDKQSSATWAADAGTGKTIQIFIASFIRNVPYSDGDYLTETYTFEQIANSLTNKYFYPNGNYANELSITMNMQDKATCSFGFIGLDTPLPTSSRASGTWVYPVDTTMLNTSSDFARLQMQTSTGTEIVSSDDAVFQDLTVTLSNNVTAKKGLGSLPTVFVTVGNLDVSISGSLYLVSDQSIISTRANDTVTLDWCISNEDGGFYFDIPSMTLGDNSRDFPANDTINVSLTGSDFKDEFFGYSFSCSKFPYLPI